MSAKDNKPKTSKTARVMNLLSKKQDAAPEEGADGAALPPIIASLAPDAAVSVQIKNALEEALDGEAGIPHAGPASEAGAPQPVEAPDTQPEAVSDVPPAEAPEAQPAEAAGQPVPQEAPAAPEVPAAAQVGYVNVMQVLVEEKAPKYVKMFGLCQCSRCMEDVKALALNHLPPKYVVLGKGEMIPKLTFYEGKYSSDITAKLLQACKIVMARPHHDR